MLTMQDPPAPSTFTASFNTTSGVFKIRAMRAWSPRGVDRLYRLLRERAYDDSRIYRVVPGWVAQFGFGGPAQRDYSVIADDPIGPASNLRGILSFSAEYSGDMQHATNRTAELYINYQDHTQLDALGFTPIAAVVEGGMDAVDAFYAGYGEMRDACDLHGFKPCDGPRGANITAQGDAYLDAAFPLLTRIQSAKLDEAPSPTPPPSPPPGRVELHIHLDGSIPPETLLRVSRARRLVLPGVARVPETVEDVWTALRSMGEVWKWFDLVRMLRAAVQPGLCACTAETPLFAALRAAPFCLGR